VYAIRRDGITLPYLFMSIAEAAEFAQEDFGLPPDADWQVVAA
jgi:hypothetical protein